MTRTLILATLAVPLLTPSTVAAKCYSFRCEEPASERTPSRSYITNSHRQIIGGQCQTKSA